MKRSSGVLLNISSLPSKFGIGGFGAEVSNFCNFLYKGAFSYWQVLPLTAIGMGNSPYSGCSAYALNYLYVDPIMMANSGYLSHDIVHSLHIDNDYVVDYNRVISKKQEAIAIAYENISQQTLEKVNEYANCNKWVVDYAMFMTLKKLNNNQAWWQWKEFRDYKLVIKSDFAKHNEKQINYYIFEQMLCDEQWQECRKICKSKSISIVGDMPIYVSLDSVEVWQCPQNFMLDKDYNPTKVAGVPPDYFCEDGQLWGNPLYDYAFMKKNGYKWWLDRLGRMFQLYDVLRIDHFRAFSEYWAVDYGATTAKDGKWCKGVGMDMLAKALEVYPAENFIAEDLGIIDDKVRLLLQQTKMMGMRVMQFGFEDIDSIHLPHNFVTECVGYTATHDNNTTLGWLNQLPTNVLEYVLKYIQMPGNDWKSGGTYSTSVRAMCKTLLASTCKLAIIPYQDLCGYGGDCRMNIPGKAEGNWTFRATSQSMQDCDWNYYNEMNGLYGRKR